MPLSVTSVQQAFQPLDGPIEEKLETELSRQAELLVERVAVGRERLAALEVLVSSLRDQLETDETTMHQLHGLLGSAAQLPLDTLDPRLRGARLREVAVAVLSERAPAEAVHYREWFSWVREAGYAVSGKDPVASFLAQVTRTPCIERVGGPRSGRYQLRRENQLER